MNLLFNNGGLKMNVLNDGRAIVDFEDSGEEISDTMVNVMWPIFEKDQPIKCYQEHVEFTEKAKKEIYDIIEKEKNELKALMLNEYRQEAKLPVVF